MQVVPIDVVCAPIPTDRKPKRKRFIQSISKRYKETVVNRIFLISEIEKQEELLDFAFSLLDLADTPWQEKIAWMFIRYQMRKLSDAKIKLQHESVF